jgi:hypothetical protein
MTKHFQIQVDPLFNLFAFPLPIDPSWKQVLPAEASNGHIYKCLSKQDDDIKNNTLHLEIFVSASFQAVKRKNIITTGTRD